MEVIAHLKLRVLHGCDSSSTVCRSEGACIATVLQLVSDSVLLYDLMYASNMNVV